MKDEYFDTIHQEGFGKDFESEYSDILHDERFGKKIRKLVRLLLRKNCERSKRKQGARTRTLKKYITRAIATRALATRTTNVDRLLL